MSNDTAMKTYPVGSPKAYMPVVMISAFLYSTGGLGMLMAFLQLVSRNQNDSPLTMLFLIFGTFFLLLGVSTIAFYLIPGVEAARKFKPDVLLAQSAIKDVVLNTYQEKISNHQAHLLAVGNHVNLKNGARVELQDGELLNQPVLKVIPVSA